MTRTITLYSAVAYDRGARIRWLAYELGLEVVEHEVDVRGGAHKHPDYLAMHPFGQVPLAVIGGHPLFDSAAACQWLLETHPAAGLAPAPGTAERARYLSWLHWSQTSLDRAVFDLFRLRRTDENEPLRTAAREKLDPPLTVLSAKVAGRDCVLGRFSHIDIVVGHLLELLRRDLELPRWPQLAAYHEQLARRRAAELSRLFRD